ncbi:MAG TPA: DUF2339 domain-containing protein [Tepidisphaeraceae bacterium]|jgi:uncharacterized membrane protein
MSEDNLSARIAALEDQIGLLAYRLQILEGRTADPPPAPVAAEQRVAPVAAEPFVAARILEQAIIPPESIPPPPFIVTENPAPKPGYKLPTRSHLNVEATIGKNLSSWIGAFLLLLGVCFFLKYAWDHQWIHPTPMMRMLAGVAAGVIVALLGEWTFRRRMKSLAGSCFGAAIAIIMASFFAGAVYFPVGQRPIDMTGAFAAVGVTTLLGIGIALRASDPTPAVIALLGAYLCPFILNTGQDESLNFLLYVTLVTVLGWGLDIFRWRWAAVRIVACLGAWASYVAWQGDIGNHHRNLAVIFAAVFYFAFLADFFFSAQRLNRRRSEAITLSLHNTLAVLSVVSTAFAFNAFYQTLHAQSLPEVGAAVVLLAIWQLLAALLLDACPLKLMSYFQAAALISLAIPLLLDHFAITLAWAIMSLVVCITARVLNLRWVYRWSISLWLLAVGRLLFDDQFHDPLWIAWFSLGALPISAGLLMAWGLAAQAHVIANLYPAIVRPAKRDPILPPILAIAGTFLFLGSKLIHGHSAEWTFSALIWTVLLLALEPILQLDYAWHILGLLMAICVKWAIIDSIIPLVNTWDAAGGSAPLPFINHSALAGLFLIALLIFCVFRLRDQSRITLSGMYTWIGMVLFLFVSIEACRCVDCLASHPDAIIKQVTLSILWALIGLVSVMVGFLRKWVGLRYAALTLLGITLLKILIVDMADVEAIWRIVSFLAVGLLLLAVSYIYHTQFSRVASE